MFTQAFQRCCQKLPHTLFVIIALLLTSEAHAVVKIGDRPCSKWTRDRAAARQQNPSAEVVWEQLVDDTWLMGYLTGLAVAGQSDYLREPDFDSLNAWIDNYCAKNPRDLLGTASNALSTELQKQMGRYEASR